MQLAGEAIHYDQEISGMVNRVKKQISDYRPCTVKATLHAVMAPSG